MEEKLRLPRRDVFDEAMAEQTRRTGLCSCGDADLDETAACHDWQQSQT